MTAAAVSATGTALIDSLLRASLEGGLAALAVLAVCRLLPALSPRLRCWLWWFVGVKLLLSLAGVGLVGLPLLPSSAPPAAVALRDLTPAAEVRPIQLPASGAPSTSVLIQSTQPSSSPPSISLRQLPSWRSVAAGLWAAGVLFGLVLLGREVVAARRLSRSAASVPADLAARAFADLPRRFGIADAPLLKVSAAVSGPQVVGLTRPQILLPPEELADVGRPELTMLLAHELAHVKRGDLWLGWVPALAHKLFFFHPLAALAVREYALAREAACDAEVLRLLGTAPREYGRMLLRWGVVLRETGLAAAGASSSARNLKRRLEMLHDASRPGGQGLRRASVAAGFVLAALLPIQIVAKSPATPATPAVPPTATTPTVAATASVTATAAAPAVASTPATPRGAAVGTTPAIASTAPVAAVAATTAATAVGSSRSSTTSYSYSDDPDAELQGWAYLEGDSSNVVMTGSGSDWKALKALRAKEGGPLLWVRRDGKSYVVRDPALLAEAKKLLEPVNELGRKQGELGAKQGELGAQQGELGGRQGELGAQQGQLGAQQAGLAAQQGLLAAQQALLAAQQAQRGANQKDLDRKHAELEAQMEKLGDQIEALGRQQSELGERQAELGEQQAALGEKQAALGEKQAELGEQQAEASRQAEKAIVTLLERALAAGKAEEVR